MTAPSEIFIKSCQKKNVPQNYIDKFSKDPQGLWDSQEDPSSMLYLLSKFSGEVDSTSRKALTKCLIEAVKPCMVNIPKGEKRPGILMEVLEKYCEGTATLAEVEKTQYDFNDVPDNASWAVLYCASFALGNYGYYNVSNAASYAARSEKNKEAEDQYNKTSSETIRKHFPSIPGMESVKAEENKTSLISQTHHTLNIRGQSFTLTEEEFQSLQKDFQKIS